MKRVKSNKILAYLWSFLALAQLINLLFAFKEADNFHRVIQIILFVFYLVSAIIYRYAYKKAKAQAG